ncbi:hypothetical protein C0995_010841 [Termitomyces sp. Mi166|nr:hypothetical protein C0995_010841 [Termitomyces sp. Mi166\
MEPKEEKVCVPSRNTVTHERDVHKEDVNSISTVTKKQRASNYKSAEFVENSSDLEELPESKPTRLSPKKFPREKVKIKESRASLKPPSKKRRKIVDSDDECTIHVLAKSESETKDIVESDEMTSLFGNSPKPKKKARASGTSGDKPRGKRTADGKSKGDPSDKHDATIKKLKSFVHACGVRKPWVKTFQDLPKPTQQIKKLREILAELGMTGRMSMEQAKRIRAERELAQELEDVKSFERSMLNRSRSQTAESSSRPSVKHVESKEDKDSEDEDDIKHRRRKIPVSRSINAFIDCESDDD